MSQNQPTPFNIALKSRLETSLLPMDRYFTVKEWETLMQNREQLFTTLGQFRTTSLEQFGEIEEAIKERVQGLGERKFDDLFEGILGIMGNQALQAHQSALEGKKKFGLYPSVQNTATKAVDFDMDKIATPPTRRGSF